MKQKNDRDSKIIKRVEKMLIHSKKTPGQLIKSHKIWFYVFMALSALGIINILIPYQDLGIASFAITFILSIIFGSAIGASIGAASNLIFSFVILWIPIAVYEYSRFSSVEHYLWLKDCKEEKDGNLLDNKK